MIKVKRAKTCAPSGCITITVICFGIEVGIVKK